MLSLNLSYVILIILCLGVTIFIGLAIMFGGYGNAGCKQLVSQMFSLQIPFSQMRISPLEFLCDIVAR